MVKGFISVHVLNAFQEGEEGNQSLCDHRERAANKGMTEGCGLRCWQWPCLSLQGSGSRERP